METKNMTNDTKFFIGYKSEIQNYLTALEQKYLPEILLETDILKVKLIIDFLKYVMNKNIDQHISIAIGNLGSDFVSLINNTDGKDLKIIQSDIDTMLNFIAQVIQEYQIRTEKSLGDEGFKLLRFIFFSPDKNSLENLISVYLLSQLPYLIFSEKMDLKIHDEVLDVEIKISNWNEKLNKFESKKRQVDELDKNLDKQKISFNFLGLSAAFNDFYTTKTKSLWKTLTMLIIIGFALIVIPSIAYKKLVDVNKTVEYRTHEGIQKPPVKSLKEIEYKKNIINYVNLYISSIPLITLELILLYFFRVILQIHNSTRSQIMQLKMRNAFCQFIEPYIEFKSKNSANTDSFEKFESFVFSAIAPNDEAIPSTFDGVEQLGKLIKTIKG
jgi:hypothetical protein